MFIQSGSIQHPAITDARSGNYKYYDGWVARCLRKNTDEFSFQIEPDPELEPDQNPRPLSMVNPNEVRPELSHPAFGQLPHSLHKTTAPSVHGIRLHSYRFADMLHWLELEKKHLED